MVGLLLTLALQQAPARVSLVFGGDVIPHDPIKAVAAAHARTGEHDNNEGWDHVLGALRPAFESADVAVVNLETPIVVLKKPERGDMVFNARPALLASLKRCGVDVATFANNHCLDQHREGIVSTRAYLEDAGLLSAGADLDEARAWTPLVFERNGLRIGLLALGRFLNGFNNTKDPLQPHVPMVAYPGSPIIGSHDVPALLDTIRAWAPQVDALIVFIHWGVEYRTKPEPQDEALAQQMLEAGAFAVVGHHPHVLQPVTFLPRGDGGVGFVAFSLGNLVSNQDFGDPNGSKRDGLLVRLELERARPGEAVQLRDWQAVPLVTENTLGGGRKRNVQALLLDDELAALDARLEELAGRKDAASKKERTQLQWKRKVAVTRKARIDTFVPAREQPDGGSVVQP